VTQGCSCFERFAVRRPRFSGETEDRALVENLMRVDVGREAGGEPTVRQGPGVPGVPSLRRGCAGSAGGQGPGSRIQDGRGGALKRRGKAQESIGPKPTSVGEGYGSSQ
jgi:hypothetical protein